MKKALSPHLSIASSLFYWEPCTEHHDNHTMSDVLSLLSLPQGASHICSALLCFGRSFVSNARAAIGI